MIFFDAARLRICHECRAILRDRTASGRSSVEGAFFGTFHDFHQPSPAVEFHDARAAGSGTYKFPSSSTLMPSGPKNALRRNSLDRRNDPSGKKIKIFPRFHVSDVDGAALRRRFLKHDGCEILERKQRVPLDSNLCTNPEPWVREENPPRNRRQTRRAYRAFGAVPLSPHAFRNSNGGSCNDMGAGRLASRMTRRTTRCPK